MFILYAVAIGLLAGILSGGRLERLSALQLRWVALALIGFAVQLVLFWAPVNRAVGEAGPPIYVASTVAVLFFVLRNLAQAGFALVAVGSLSNLAAIVANGGYMPTTPEAVAAAGLPPLEGYSNSVQTQGAALAPLTDIFAMPPWMPFANVFSLGDVLLGLGIAIAVAGGMRDAPALGARQRPSTWASIALSSAPFAAAGTLVAPVHWLGRSGVVPSVTPRSMVSTNGALPVPPALSTVGIGSETRCSTSLLTRANPSRGGDAKPGITGSARSTARLPGRRRGPTTGGVQ